VLKFLTSLLGPVRRHVPGAVREEVDGTNFVNRWHWDEKEQELWCFRYPEKVDRIFKLGTVDLDILAVVDVDTKTITWRIMEDMYGGNL
jgi:hypothetical protein